MILPGQFDLGFDLPVNDRAPFDVCAAKHQGAETSVESNEVVDKAFQRTTIRRLLLKRKSLCIHEIVKLTGWAANRFSGRISEMLADELIMHNGVCEGHGTKARVHRLTELGKQLAQEEAKI